MYISISVEQLIDGIFNQLDNDLINVFFGVNTIVTLAFDQTIFTIGHRTKIIQVMIMIFITIVLNHFVELRDFRIGLLPCLNGYSATGNTKININLISCARANSAIENK